MGLCGNGYLLCASAGFCSMEGRKFETSIVCVQHCTYRYSNIAHAINIHHNSNVGRDVVDAVAICQRIPETFVQILKLSADTCFYSSHLSVVTNTVHAV